MPTSRSHAKVEVRQMITISPKDFARYRDEIASLRMKGLSAQQIAETLRKREGLPFTASKINGFAAREGLPRSPRGVYRPAINFGYVALRENLNHAQCAALERLAKDWGCETLAEAAIEILRDHLEQMDGIQDVEE